MKYLALKKKPLSDGMALATFPPVTMETEQTF